MSSKILVTGGTGTTGSFLIEKLQSMDIDFTAMVRSLEKAKKLHDKKVKTIIGDFSDQGSLEKVLYGFDKIFLLSGASKDKFLLESNVVLAAKANGVEHIVKLSAIGTSLDAPIGLIRQHAKTEALIRESGIAYTFLHPHSFMQNLFMQIPSIKSDEAIYAPYGDAKISLVDTRDNASIAAKVLTEEGHEGKTYVITGPEAITFYQVAEAIGAALGKEINYMPVGLEDAKSAMLEAGTPDWLAEDLTILNKIFSDGHGAEVSHHTETVLGHKGHTIHEFVQDFAFMFQ